MYYLFYPFNNPHFFLLNSSHFKGLIFTSFQPLLSVTTYTENIPNLEWKSNNTIHLCITVFKNETVRKREY